MIRVSIKNASGVEFNSRVLDAADVADFIAREYTPYINLGWTVSQEDVSASTVKEQAEIARKKKYPDQYFINRALISAALGDDTDLLALKTLLDAIDAEYPTTRGL